MPWEIRNTFLNFYEDMDHDNEHDSNRHFHDRKRSVSVPAVMTRATILKDPKIDVTRDWLVKEKSIGDAATDDESRASANEPEQEPTPRKEDDVADVAASPLTRSPSEAGVTDQKKSKRSRRRAKARHLAAAGPSEMKVEEEEYESSVRNPGVTLMIRNIACRYTQQQIGSGLDDLGFAGTYDSVHLPLNAARTANMGYFFVKFSTQGHAEEFWARIEGRVFGSSLTSKKCEVSFALMQDHLPASRKDKTLSPSRSLAAVSCV